jgi:hypothetical protein
MKWAGHITLRREKRNVYRLLVGKSEGKRPLGRPRRSWVHDIKIDLEEIKLTGMDWIILAQDKDKSMTAVKAAMNFWIL